MQEINLDTATEKHWAVESSHTNKVKSGKTDENVIINSLQKDVEKRVKVLQKHNSSSEFLEDKLDIQKSQLFNAPKFSKDYTALTARKYFTGAQRWLGHILDIKENFFTAQLIDLNDTTTYEIGEFEFKEISQDDIELVTIGASFYWSIGYSDYNGQKEKKSLIRFQRINPWKEKDYDEAKDRADSLFIGLNWE